ncbi:MAG: FeoA domain-containing protein [Candidatus Hydrogenedentes bacterium]|nr:FeoA domain-containing protein [Candidatus Hydrogenedentota bacterium]
MARVNTKSNPAASLGTGIECPLTACAAGEEVVVIELLTETGLTARLREMGLVSGASLRVVSNGIPMILELGETRLCLRGADAEGVFVRVAEPSYAGMCFDELLEDADPA